MRLLFLASLFTLNTYAAFIPIPTAPITVYGLPTIPKGSLVTSNGTVNGSSDICADGEILEWDAAETDGVKCVAKPVATPAPNYAIGGSCGLYNTTSTSYTLITNFSVTLTTTGGPVKIEVTPDGSNSGNSKFFTAGLALLEVRRGATPIATVAMDPQTPNNYGEINSIDVVAAGTYTYTVYVRAPSSAQFDCQYLRLTAREIK